MKMYLDSHNVTDVLSYTTVGTIPLSVKSDRAGYNSDYLLSIRNKQQKKK